jgi:hypothetical protein
MVKRTLKRKQKLYTMKGCSKCKSKKHGRRKCNNFRKGGSGIRYHLNPETIMPETNISTNSINKTIPNPGPEFRGVSTIPTNQSMMQKGGNCGCNNIMSGGNRSQKGGTWAPQGLIGEPWKSSPADWPGVNGSRNYLEYNQFINGDPQTSMISLGSNPPFLTGGKKSRSSKRRKQKGGALSNFLLQDFINLGRQTQFNLGSAYNGINGYSAPINPLPWKDQMLNSSSAIRNALI